MKKLILTGLTALSLVACSGGFQTNKNETQTILRSKFGEPLPEWVKNKYTEENDKIYFVSEIVRNEKSNNTAHLERVASLDATAQLAQMAAQNINDTIKNVQNNEGDKGASSSLNSISHTNIKISSAIPVNTYWQLIQYKDGEKEYHAFAKVRVDKEKLTDAMTSALIQANPGMDASTAKGIVSSSVSNMSMENVTPNEKIF